MLPAKEGLRWLALRTGPQSLKELMVKKEYFQSGDRRGKIVWELREFHCCGIEGLCERIWVIIMKGNENTGDVIPSMCVRLHLKIPRAR